MKNFTAVLFFLVSLQVWSQTYVLDESFGDQGKKYFPGTSFAPTGGLVLNGNYFFNSSTKIAKVDYGGNFVSNFGVSGFLSPYPDASDFYITKIKAHNNQIYILGALNVGTTRDAFICRMDENGILDTAFGNNGKAVIDFGQAEFISDFIIEPSGKIFCTGDRFGSSTASTVLIYLRLNANGSIDTTFDSNGYKFFDINYTTTGKYIAEYEDGYLLVGATKLIDVSVTSDLLLLKVQTNGNIDSGFGNNGYKSIHNIGGISGFTGIDATGPNQLYNGKLYLSVMRQSGFNYIFGSMLVFDIATEQVNRFGGPYDVNYFNAAADGLMVTGYENLNCIGNPLYACHNTFNLRREYLDASALDPTFQNNSVYTYSFPALIESNCKSYIFLRDDNGKILIAGYSFVSSTPTWQGFSLIRLRAGVLSTPTVNEEQGFQVTPNPFDQMVVVSLKAAVKNVSVFDLQGRNVATPAFNPLDKNVIIDLSDLKQRGTYIVKITTVDGQTVAKGIIKK